MFILDGKFRFAIVDTEELRQEIYRLRYQVYVEEFGFEHPEDHPGGLEVDPYDSHSVHLAVLNEVEQLIGTARLVLYSDKGFPIEHAVNLDLRENKPPPERTAEISRLTLSRLYRRRSQDGQYGLESYMPSYEGEVLSDKESRPPQYEKRRCPTLIIIGLFKLIWQETKRLGLTHWYMISEKKLWSALYRYGLFFRQVGEPVDYHGKRIPYMISLAEFEEHLRQANPPLYQTFLDDLEEEYRP